MTLAGRTGARKDTQLENALLQLNKAAIKHDRNPETWSDRSYLVEMAAAEDDD